MRYAITDCSPCSGDLVLARVEALGHHRNLHLPDGRRRSLFVGDEIVVTYANRYASNQFEAMVPEGLGTCHLVAGGGVAATVTEQHNRIRRGPTLIRPVGLLTGEHNGAPINIANYALPASRAPETRIPTLAIVGTGMDSGKTTTAAFLAKGICQLDRRPGYAKVTGTGAANDPALVTDAGAEPVLDFTDVGYASTYRVSPLELETIFEELIAHLHGDRVDVILLEVADGLYQRETSALLCSPVFRHYVDGIVLAAGDAMGAGAGVSWLKAQGLPLIALAGMIENAPLQMREAKAVTGLPIYTRDDLASTCGADALVASAIARPNAIPSSFTETAAPDVTQVDTKTAQRTVF